MAQNYTFNGSLTMSATSASGYTSSMSGSYNWSRSNCIRKN